jgi:hypothetical protein
MAGRWKTWKTKLRFPTVSHRPLEIANDAISTFPHSGHGGFVSVTKKAKQLNARTLRVLANRA